LPNSNFAAAAAACKVPTAYLGATRPIADLELFRSYCPQLMSSQVVGSGHFLQLEVPEQVNSMLDRFLSSLRARSADDCTGRGDEFDKLRYASAEVSKRAVEMSIPTARA